MRFFFAATLVVAGCSYRTGSAMYVTVSAAISVVDSLPADLDTNVPLGAPVTVVLSDFPDPDSVAPPSVELLQGSTVVDSVVTVDLVNRAINIQPTAALSPNTDYVARLATLDDNDPTIPPVAGLSKLKLGTMNSDPFVNIRFTTGSTPGGGPTPPPAYTLAKDIQALFDFVAPLPIDGGMNTPDPNYDQCSSMRGCHAPGVDDTGKATLPQDMLDLSDGKSGALLVNVDSVGSKLKRVVPGHPEQSYLLRKLLGTPDIAGLQMPSGETDRWDPASTQMISDWILEGAN